MTGVRTTSLGRRILDALALLISVVVILIAISITLIRITLPEIESQKLRLEAWLSGVIERPVKITALNASWRAWTPTLVASQVDLFDAGGERKILSLGQIEIEVSPLDSLMQNDLIAHELIVRGVKLTLRRDRDGRIQLAGFPPGETHFLDWLWRRSHVTIIDSALTIIDAASDQLPLDLDNITLELANTSARHVVRGTVGEPHRLGDGFEFSFAKRHRRASGAEAARLNISAHSFDVATLLDLLLPGRELPLSGRISGELQTRFNGRELVSAAFRIRGRKLAFHERELGDLAHPSLHGRAVRDGRAWAVELDGLRDSPAPIRARLQVEEPQLRLSADALPASLVTALLGDKKLPGATIDTAALTVRGWLRGVRLGLKRIANYRAGYYLAAQIEGLAVNYDPGQLDLKGLDSELALNETGGIAVFDDPAAVLNHGERLIETLELKNLSGALRWRQTPQGLRVETDTLGATIQRLPLSVNGKVDFSNEAAPHVDTHISIAAGPANAVHKLVPRGVLRPRAEHWLRKAFRRGELREGELRFKGRFDEFPWASNDDSRTGTVAGEMAFAGVDFQFSQKWPAALNASGRVRLNGRKIDAVLDDGQIFTSKLSNVRVQVPDLLSDDPRVQIEGKSHTNFADVRKLIEQSPLKKSKTRRVLDLDIAQDFSVKLDLDLGLKPGTSRTMHGVVSFADNSIRSKQANVSLANVAGEVHFSPHHWGAENLAANLDEQAVTLTVSGTHDADDDVVARLAGRMDAHVLSDYLRRYLPDTHRWLAEREQPAAFRGATAWQAELTLPGRQAKGGKRIVIRSNLVGLAVDLPAPLGKSAARAIPIRLETTLGDPLRAQTSLTVGNIVAANILGTNKAANELRRLERMEIAFGAQPASHDWPQGAGVFIRGELASFATTDWLSTAQSSPRGAAPAAADLPIDIDVTIAKLHGLGHDLGRLRVRGYRDRSVWRLRVDGDAVGGDITVPRARNREPLTLNLSHLKLVRAAPDGDRDLDPKRIPALVLVSDAFKYEELDLGTVIIASEHAKDGIELNTLLFENEDFRVHARGAWEITDAGHQSRFKIDVTGTELAGVLEGFGYKAAGVEGGATAIRIDAQWPGTPSQFTLARLRGQFDLQVDNGRLLDIEPGGGRLFGLLSVQTLPRRLALDFDDLFQKGFTFDRIEGSFQLDAGDAYTNGVIMAGPSGSVTVTGRTGLSNKDYDQRVIVTPALANSIPLAGALFGPAGVGVGAALYLSQKMFKSIPAQVDRLLSREYAVSGTWDAPVIEKI